MKKINNIKLFQRILGDLIEFINKNNLNWKHFNYKDIEFFYYPQKYIDWKLGFLENKQLKELSKDLEKQYQNIKAQDIYFLIPQILCKINSFILFDKDNINIDYYYILSDFLNFIPENKKPVSFSEYKDSLNFYEEIMFKTLDKIDEDFKNFKIEFSLKLWVNNHNKSKELQIDEKIYISIDKKWITEIKGVYTDWYLWDRIQEAIDHLFLIINILELNWIFHIEDTNKSVFHEKMYVNNKKFDINNFSFTKDINYHSVNHFYYIQKYLWKFYESPIVYIDLEYFYLLSKKLRNTKLITASNFFWTDIFRFESKEFLNYWQAIEVMLWSPEKNIKEELKNKFDLFFPNTTYIEDFWKIRNWIVHRWVLHVDRNKLKEIERISKHLFLKLILANYK